MDRLLQHPVVLLALCFALIGTPVTYRGGASNAHPHMFLEFLLDASGGSFGHHHGEQRDDDGGAAHEHTAEHHHGSSASEPAAGQPVFDAAERFAPSLSAFVVGDVSQLAFVVPQHDLPVADAISNAFDPAGVAPTGLVHAPIAPPPR